MDFIIEIEEKTPTWLDRIVQAFQTEQEKQEETNKQKGE